MKKLTALLLTLALSLSLSVPALAAEFSDVPAGHWAYDAIRSAAEDGVASGYADGTFRPTHAMTNAQFAVMLSRAFYPAEAAALRAQSGFRPWYWADLRALHNHELLVGTALAAESRWSENANGSVSRYDAAQLMYNLLTARGLTATLDQRATARAKIADWASIHSGYRMAVSTCYALGLVSGQKDGAFQGAAVLNRAQGCVFVDRMRTLLTVRQEGPLPGEPTPKEVPTAVGVSSARFPTETGVTTGWTISDSGFASGLLNNGKLITQDNVLAMLDEAKELWYDGMPWGGVVTGNNNYYDGYAYDGALTWGGELVANQGGTPTTTAGGFAAMISDYLFGLHSNAGRKLDDNTKVRPGDVIFQMSNGRLVHSRIALTTVQYQKNVPFVSTCDGNIHSQVSWDEPGEETSCRLDGYTRDDGAYITCVIYTRYPD